MLFIGVGVARFTNSIGRTILALLVGFAGGMILLAGIVPADTNTTYVTRLWDPITFTWLTVRDSAILLSAGVVGAFVARPRSRSVVAATDSAGRADTYSR